MTGILDLSMLGDRKHETVTIPKWQDYTRDNGKMFVIVEWPATTAERWAMKVWAVIKGTGGRIVEDDIIPGMGMVGIAKLGLNAILAADIDVDRLMPLMDELIDGCVYAIRDAAHPDIVTSVLGDADISEVKTRMWLRSEVLRVHTGFSMAERLSRLLSAALSTKELTNSSAM